jgi:uncharacterized iron-regulated protein
MAAAANAAGPWQRRMQRMPLPRRLALRRGAALALLALAGCGSPPPQPTPPPTHLRAGPGQALLLGEVHDNAAQHALRRDLLAALLAHGDRPALLLEQFDREHQAALDAASRPLAQASPAALDAQVDAVVQAGHGAPGWHWPFYRPYIRLALAHGLPIVAANVSRADARVVMQRGLAATGWRADVPDDIRLAQAGSIEASHCGQLDAAAAARLSQAQVARDQFMARLVDRHAGRGVVLLAGNGHVRADIGVPRWLAPDLRARTQVVGALEAGGATGDTAGPQPYDTVLRTAAQPRPDPCAGLRMPAGASAPA